MVSNLSGLLKLCYGKSSLPHHQYLTTTRPGHKFNTTISSGHSKFNTTGNNDTGMIPNWFKIQGWQFKSFCRPFLVRLQPFCSYFIPDQVILIYWPVVLNRCIPRKVGDGAHIKHKTVKRKLLVIPEINSRNNYGQSRPGNWLQV